MARNLQIRLLSIIVFFSLICGCSKGTKPGTDLLEVSVLKKIPASTYAFFVWDTSSPGYQRYKTSPWGEGQNSRILELFQNPSFAEQKETIDLFMDVLRKTGLIVTSPNQVDPIKEGVFFSNANSTEQKLQIGGLFSAAAGIDFRDKLSALNTVFKEHQFEITKENFKGVDGFALKRKDSSSAPLQELFFAANQNYLALSSSASGIETLFATQDENGIATIKNTPQFQRALQSVSPTGTSSAEQICFGYVDTGTFLQKITQVLPGDNKDELVQKINSIPAESLAFSSVMAEGPNAALAVQFSPKTDDQRRWASALSGSGNNSLAAKLPAGVLFFVSLDGKLLQGIKNAALAEVPAEELASLKNELALVDSLHGAALAVRNSSGASPFPELLILAESDKPGEVLETLKNQVNSTLQTSGMMASPWQEMDIAGAKAQYIMSPLGIGAYAASSGNTLFVGSTEKALADSIQASSSSDKGVFATLPKQSVQTLQTAGSLISGLGDFKRIAELAESLQGNLAMFTGGAPNSADNSMEYLKKLGLVTVTVNFTNNTLKINSSYAPAKE